MVGDPNGHSLDYDREVDRRGFCCLNGPASETNLGEGIGKGVVLRKEKKGLVNAIILSRRTTKGPVVIYYGLQLQS